MQDAESIEEKKIRLKVLVSKEKFKINRPTSQSSIESYEFPDSPKIITNEPLNDLANNRIAF